MSGSDVFAQWLGTVGLIITTIGGLVAVIRSWIRGPKEDKKLEADIQDTVTAMAQRWLKEADERLKAAEVRAEHAEAKVDSIRREFMQYKKEKEEELVQYRLDKEAELKQLVKHLVTVHDWIDSGAKPPRPVWPNWLPPRRK